MSLNVSYNQNYGIDTQALREVTQQIFKRAEGKVGQQSNNANVIDFKRNTLGVDFYNGRTDAATARQVAMNNSGLQVNLNQNLMQTVQFLNTEAAKSTLKNVEGKMTVAVNEEAPIAQKTVQLPKFNTLVKASDLNNEKQGSNPFYQGQLLQGKSEKKEEESLNIFA